jgi:hypothetical protein
MVPPALRCLYEELAEHGVDEIWRAMNDLGKLGDFLQCDALKAEHNDGSEAM